MLGHGKVKRASEAYKTERQTRRQRDRHIERETNIKTERQAQRQRHSRTKRRRWSQIGRYTQVE